MADGQLRRPPGLVIRRRGIPLAAAQEMARRYVSALGAGQVRQMRLFPIVMTHGALGRRLVMRVMQPAMPFRGNLGRFGLSFENHPALFLGPLVSAQLGVYTAAIIAVAERVGTDELAAKKGV